MSFTPDFFVTHFQPVIDKVTALYLNAGWLELLEEVPLEGQRNFEQCNDGVTETACVLRNNDKCDVGFTDVSHFWDNTLNVDTTTEKTGIFIFNIL